MERIKTIMDTIKDLAESIKCFLDTLKLELYDFLGAEEDDDEDEI